MRRGPRDRRGRLSHTGSISALGDNRWNLWTACFVFCRSGRKGLSTDCTDLHRLHKSGNHVAAGVPRFQRSFVVVAFAYPALTGRANKYRAFSALKLGGATGRPAVGKRGVVGKPRHNSGPQPGGLVGICDTRWNLWIACFVFCQIGRKGLSTDCTDLHRLHKSGNHVAAGVPRFQRSFVVAAFAYPALTGRANKYRAFSALKRGGATGRPAVGKRGVVGKPRHNSDHATTARLP